MCGAIPLPAGAGLSAAHVNVTTLPGKAVTGNVTAGMVGLEPGATAAVVGVKLPGDDHTAAPGGGLMAVVNAISGATAGMLQVQADGSFTFTPTPILAAPVPPVHIMVASAPGRVVHVGWQGSDVVVGTSYMQGASSGVAS